MYSDMKKLIGKKILKIFMNSDFLKFETDQGNVVFTTYGDCCSHSYFYDFIGVKKLLENGPVEDVEQISLGDFEVGDYGGLTRCYGFRIITEDPKFGEVSSVVSFRNDSNGYYGGSLEDTEDTEVSPEITDDVLEVSQV